MKEDTELTPERMDELLRFLPAFEAPDRVFVKWRGGEKQPDGAITMPFPEYPADVSEFFHLAAQPWWTDRGYEGADAAAILENDAALRTATLTQVQSILTYCVRGERFCDGHWAALLESGRVVALLRRLLALRETTFRAGGGGPVTGCT